MRAFDVLDPDLDLTHHYLLEASAGTGKTYSIENIILRLLIEGEEPLQLEQILAVTFTRAAVADMRVRVRENLRRAAAACQQAIAGGNPHGMPPFLQRLISTGGDNAAAVKRRLDNALGAFDQAHICTIHAFCARMLRENMLDGGSLVHASTGESDVPMAELRQIARDYLRTELTSSQVSAGQLKRIVDHHQAIDKLIDALARSITSLMPIVPSRNFCDVFQAACEAMPLLKQELGITAKKLAEDAQALAPYYNEVKAGKVLKPELAAKAEWLGSLFEKENITPEDFDLLIEENGFWNNTFSVLSKRAPSTPPVLHFPSFADRYRETVEKIVLEAGDPQAIFSVLAAGCQAMGQKILLEGDRQGFNSLLSAMHKACENPSFAAKVRSRYKAVIIDEFQDTDPLQWEIFKTLFPPGSNSWGRLFLVGDPKQSIYAFRQADIYTYLAAARDIQEPWRARLDRNFRSSPSLVEALNVLFSEENAPGLIPLPRLGQHLEYVPVAAGGKVADAAFGDDKGSLHAYLIEGEGTTKRVDERIMPFVAEEIRRLHVEQGRELSAFAILVADRHQAKRCIDFLQRLKIPAAYQRAASLAQSRAVGAMRELLAALVNPRDEKRLKVALGGPVLGWTNAHVEGLSDLNMLQDVLEKMHSLRKILWEDGFSPFLEALMSSSWDDAGTTVEERLLSTEDRGAFYSEWMQVCDWLVETHSRSKATPEQLIGQLLDLETGEDERDDLKVPVAVDAGVVQVLSIHSSKGLEFDIVFPLGLYHRKKTRKELVPVPDGAGGYTARYAAEKSPDYINYRNEIDAEKLRQLYVAMTRAKYRLYVPFVFSTRGTKIEASPIDLYLACSGIARADEFAVKLRAQPQGNAITFSYVDENAPLLVPLEVPPPPPLAPQVLFEMPGKELYLKSYTALAHPAGHSTEPERTPPSDYAAEWKTPYTLPAGSEVGILLHSILETIPFTAAREAADSAVLLPFIRPLLAGTAFHAWESAIAAIVFAALRTPLFDGVAPLADIDDVECYREMEFLFPAASDFGFDGYLKGVIDLIFHYRGKYYLVDWKSNWLGPESADYGEEPMRRAMAENDYLLQARIYEEALRRYLHLVDDEQFGGTAYVFLRGISASTGVVRI